MSSAAPLTFAGSRQLSTILFDSLAKGNRVALLAATLFAGVALQAQAGALRTRFSDVAMDDVPIGATVAPLLPDGTGYTLVNDSNGPLSVRMSAERPTFCEPLPGHPLYKPLPPSCNVGFEPEAFVIAPHATNAVLVKVALPDDPALAGKGFEFWIRAEAMAGQGGVALVSRVRIDTRKAEGEGESKRIGES